MNRVVHFFLVAMALLLTTCGNFRTVEVRLFLDESDTYIATPDKEIQAILDEASEIIGYEIVPVRNAPIDVELVDLRERKVALAVGRHYQRGPCRHFIRSTYKAQTLAHEMAHALGLGHTDDINNLMYPEIRGASFLTVAQRRTMRKNAKRQEILCWDNTEPQERFAIEPDSRGQPKFICLEQAVDGRKEAQPSLVGPEETTETGDETTTTGVRGDGSSTGWPILFEWMRPGRPAQGDVRRRAEGSVR